MDCEIQRLQVELQVISDEIQNIQDKLESMDNNDKSLLRCKKDLQYQALFYMDKIENLKEK